jgi:hypothetical protein
MSDVARSGGVDPTQSGPEAPNITKKDIWAQFWVDIKGKEVQSVETYSHSWVANQLGHVCLGILLVSLLGVALGAAGSWFNLWYLRAPWNVVAGSFLTAIGVSIWEWWAYRIAEKNATGRFPLDRRLLRDNAVIAAAYMVIGVMMALVHHFFAETPGLWVVCFLGLVIVAILLALRWLRQKIVWQKAGLPYLFRLSDTRPTMGGDDATELQRLIESKAPRATKPCAIVIGGPIGSGRTEFAAAIGTEFAFRQAKVRYLSFSTLLEFVARSKNSPDFFNDIGPSNISYWPWSKAQVVIIDDIGPLLKSQAPSHEHPVKRFQHVLDDQLITARAVLAECHTVWVIGDLRGAGQVTDGAAALDQCGDEIRRFCTLTGEARPQVLVAQLAGDPEAESTPQGQQRAKTPRIATIHYLH